MRHQTRSTTTSAPTTRTASGTSRWLVVAISLCGALAGASIVESLAALTSHVSAPISPDHLIAAPLAVAGALCGGLLAAVLVSKDRRMDEAQTDAATERVLSADIIPGEAMFWQPTPTVTPRARISEPAAPITSPSVRARRVRRAIRQRGYRHGVMHSNLARPATHH